MSNKKKDIFQTKFKIYNFIIFNVFSNFYVKFEKIILKK
jgi:hypothetical protein